VTDYQSEVAQTFVTIGALQHRNSELEASVASYQRGIGHQRSAVAAAPNDSDYSRLLGRQLAGLAQAFRQFGKRTEAQRLFEEAREIIGKLPRPTATDRYDLARMYAACALLVGDGKPDLNAGEHEQQTQGNDQAIAFLRESIAAGFHDVDGLQKCPEFTGLRSNKDFQTLIADLRHKSNNLQWETNFEAAKVQAAREKARQVGARLRDQRLSRTV
jgi:tetratricopeptide (TPR) repeat protein